MEPSPLSESGKWDPLFEIEGDHVKLAYLAFCEFEKQYGKKYDFSKYTLYFDVADYEDEQVHKVGLIPMPISVPSDGIFDIPVQGVWTNGPGISFLFEPETFKLLKFTRMR